MFKGTRFWQASAFCAALMLAAVASAAGLYKWVDSEGNVQYSQDPPPQGNYQSITPPAPVTAPAEEDAQPANQQESGDQPPPPAEEDVTKKQQATLDKLNCEAGRKNLDLYTRHRRFVDSKGEVVTMDDKERAAKIKEAEEMVKQYCK